MAFSTEQNHEISTLQTKVERLEHINENLESENKKLQMKIAWYEEQVRQAMKSKYAPKSERFERTQLDLFNEAEELQNTKLVEPDVEIITYQRKKRIKEKKLDLSDLPVETIEYTIDDAKCPSCDHDMHTMTKEIRRELKVIPAKLTVIEHVSHVYACRYCEEHNIHTPIIKAESPNSVIPKSVCSPSLLAHIMNRKYAEAIPLYRQEQQFHHLGITLLRQNLANWIVKGSVWLEPVYQRMREHLLKEDIIHSDETTLQVLHEKDRKAQNKSYMWLYMSGGYAFPMVLYDYQETRAHRHPIAFLKGFKGYAHVDGYAAYNDLEGVTLVGCHAHARRQFDEAIKIAPKKEGAVYTTAHEGLTFFAQLFMIERKIKDLTVQKRYEARMKESLPLMNAFKDWLNRKKEVVLPKSKLGQAIKYTLNQWDKLKAYLLDGRLEISNNRAERAIKPFVIGRKNWLFSNTPKGARASAIIYSVVETAKLNHLSPYHYLEYLFERLPNMEIKEKTLDRLMPWSPEIPDSLKSMTKDKEKEKISES